MRGLLRVEEAIFNVMPIARSLEMPDELLDRVKKSWPSEDLQVTAVLQYALKDNYVEDLSALRQKLEDLEQGHFPYGNICFFFSGCWFWS